MPNSNRDEIIKRLMSDIDNDVGVSSNDDIEKISSVFDQSIRDALHSFNSNSFDSDGFIKKLGSLEIDGQDKDLMKNVLNSVRGDFVGLDLANQSELLLRRDIYNVCTQMPEMRDVINIVRDSIIECNVATGQVSRSFSFSSENDSKKTEGLKSMAEEIEKKFNLLMAIKNFIVPNTLMHGELYINVVPYSKLFAELDALSEVNTYGAKDHQSAGKQFHESVPPEVSSFFQESHNLDTEENVQILMESVSSGSKVDAKDSKVVEGLDPIKRMPESKEVIEADMHAILSNIEVCNGSSVMFNEMGPNGFREFLKNECGLGRKKPKKNVFQQFQEASQFGGLTGGLFSQIDQDDIDSKPYQEIKGCYVKYLDGLRVVPIRVDRNIAGYYYATTTLELHNNPATSNGIIDLSYQTYTRDKKMVSQLADIIIKNFDRKMLEKNIKLKAEIAEIIEAHKFTEGRLSFIYIPEDEIVRLVINEDENGKGHSILEPSIFAARTYMMLTLYSIIYTLNNNTTRVHYVKSSGLNKDYASQIQRTIRKFQSGRVSVDDLYSYMGFQQKLGAMSEMVLPAGRSDFKALETDTIPAVENPINMELLERQRRQAIAGTGVPNMMVVNAIDEVDFAKTLEMANARYLSTISAYKIDFNDGLTRLYRTILKYSTEIDDDDLVSLRFEFNAVKQQELVITSEMINNFNATIELEESLFFKENELKGEDGNPTQLRMEFRKARAKELLPQLDIDHLEDLVSDIRNKAKEAISDKKAEGAQNIDKDDLSQLGS